MSINWQKSNLGRTTITAKYSCTESGLDTIDCFSAFKYLNGFLNIDAVTLDIMKSSFVLDVEE